MVLVYLNSLLMNKDIIGVHSIIISDDLTGQRIDNFLRTYLKKAPKSMIYRIVRKGEVRVNKKKVTPAYKLNNHDEVRIPPFWQIKRDQASIIHTLDKNFELNDILLYEDDHLLILNKPAGTAVHGGSGLSFNVIENLRRLRPNVRYLELVHRLDRNTSGILMIAKKRSALRALHEQLRAREIQKRYIALVRGHWNPQVKIVSAPLLKNVHSNEHLVRVNSKGKLSETRFKVEEKFTIATLVQVNPITGRTHQIRVHAQYANHPIAFDDRYGDNAFDKKLKKFGLNRLFLHAATLHFKHPSSGKVLCIEAPLDSSLHQCLLCLRSYCK